MISSNPILQRASGKQKRLILVGGFLGAGKTTLIGKLVRDLQSGGLRCGVVTNDQAAGLVDTALAETLDGARISEIAGGCFCCKLDQLEELLTGQWQNDPSTCPDVIVAEPVGSCTDLIATVVLPLRRIYGEDVVISPFSVVLDGRRALAGAGELGRAADSGGFFEGCRLHLPEADRGGGTGPGEQGGFAGGGGCGGPAGAARIEFPG